MELETGVSAHRGSGKHSKERHPDQTIADLIKLYPRDDKDDTEKKFLEIIFEDQEPSSAVRTCVVFYYSLSYGKIYKSVKASMKSDEELAAEAEARAAEKAKRDAERMAILKNNIARLAFETIMPNGLRLADCNIGYMQSLGGVCNKLGERGEPHQRVSDVWTAEEVEAINAQART